MAAVRWVRLELKPWLSPQWLCRGNQPSLVLYFTISKMEKCMIVASCSCLKDWRKQCIESA